MLSHITIATDGSEASARMLECLPALRSVGTREVLLVHVFDVRNVGGLYESLRKSMRPKLERQLSVLKGGGFQGEIATPLGIPFYEINKLASCYDIGLAKLLLHLRLKQGESAAAAAVGSPKTYSGAPARIGLRKVAGKFFRQAGEAPIDGGQIESG